MENHTNQKTNFKFLEWEQRKVDQHNNMPGRLPDYECDLCLNRGNIAFIGENGNITLKKCKCMEKRKMIKNAKKTGAYELMLKYKFSNYTVKDKWQKTLYDAAVKYSKSDIANWFFLGGQTGAGKTHICTAIIASMLQRDIVPMYIMWPQEIRQLTTAGFANYDSVNDRIDQLCKAEFLYIDDLFKSDDRKPPDNKEIGMAFEILNIRYFKNLPTIISSEYTNERISSLNHALAGRIRERCGEYEFSIGDDPQKDWRNKQ